MEPSPWVALLKAARRKQDGRIRGNAVGPCVGHRPVIRPFHRIPPRYLLTLPSTRVGAAKPDSMPKQKIEQCGLKSPTSFLKFQGGTDVSVQMEQSGVGALSLLTDFPSDLWGSVKV